MIIATEGSCLLWVHIHALSCMTIIQLSISFFLMETNVQPGHRKQVWTARSNPSVLLPQCLPVCLSYVLSTLRPCSPSHAPFSRHDFASTLSQCSQVGSSPRAGFSILSCSLESLGGRRDVYCPNAGIRCRDPPMITSKSLWGLASVFYTPINFNVHLKKTTVLPES